MTLTPVFSVCYVRDHPDLHNGPVSVVSAAENQGHPAHECRSLPARNYHDHPGECLITKKETRMF